MLEWKTVPGYEGYYEVSNNGNVRSLDRVVRRSDGVEQLRHGCMCNLLTNKDGYIYVNLSKDGVRKKIPVHRLVYQAFVSSIPDGYDIDHIDFDRANNCIENLQMLTHSDNVKRTVIAGRHYTSITDLSGANNPNYGNKALSSRYAENPGLAKDKQSRPGGANGRATPIAIKFQSGEEMSFGYIRECADYLRATGFIKGTVAASVSALSKAARTGEPYRGMNIRYI